MKKVEVIEGVVAEYNGQYWGKQIWGEDGFGDISKAIISEPRFCKEPTNLTSKFDKVSSKALSKAKLVKVKKTITLEFEILN